MIRKSIEPGAQVFHEIYGLGTFISWSAIDGNQSYARVRFNASTAPGYSVISRKELTEIEPAPAPSS